MLSLKKIKLCAIKRKAFIFLRDFSVKTTVEEDGLPKLLSNEAC